MKYPTFAEMRKNPIMSCVVGLLELVGITNEDLPDIVPDDILDTKFGEFQDPAVMEKYFPQLATKLRGIEDGLAS